MSFNAHHNVWMSRMEELDRRNLELGRCIDCGGTGVVANLSSSDPHANRTCRRCKGDGKARLVRCTPPEGKDGVLR
jgi:DnaJ-class molecular chaperone